MSQKKVLLIVLDGVAENLQEGKETPLQKSYKPMLDAIAKSGVGGLLENNIGLEQKIGPGCGISFFSLLGYDVSEYPGRGYFEALGVGANVRPTDVCMRANFCTVEEGPLKIQPVPENPKTEMEKQLIVKDRRAGRDTEALGELAASIKKINVNGGNVEFYRSLGYRGVAILNQMDAHFNISDSDPGKDGMHVQNIVPLSNDPGSQLAASTMQKWSEEVHSILSKHTANKFRKTPANYVLLRGASQYQHIKPFKEKFGMSGAVVAASPVVKGICKALEMEVINIIGASGDAQSNLRDKTLAALDALRKHNFVVLHILGTDYVSHLKKADAKRGFIEKLDREVFTRIREYVDAEKTIIAVASDHVSSLQTGEHEHGAFPFAIYTKGIKPNEVAAFDEVSCKEPLGPKTPMQNFMEILMQYVQQ